MTPNVVIFSYPGVGSIPAATYSFLTAGYKPPKQGRSIASDMVHNQNGIFVYVYDSGPNIFTWDPFELVFGDSQTHKNILGIGATQQWQNFQDLWQHLGTKQLDAPEDLYDVHFAQQDMERRFTVFPKNVGDPIEFRVTIELEEG
jgi:hypothetical protein